VRYLDRQIPSELRSFIESQDVLQDTLFEAFQRADQFVPDGDDAVFRWMATIARRRVAALLRMQRALKRGGKREAAENLSEVVEALEELARYERTPSRSAMAHEMASAIQDSISRLEPQYRDAVRLRYVDGLSIKEVSGRMRRTEGAILMLCNRGLKALKADLQSKSFFL